MEYGMKSERRNNQLHAICLVVTFTSMLIAASYADENRQLIGKTEQLKSELVGKTEQLKECEGLYKVLADQHSKHIGSEACNTDNLLKEKE